MAIKNSVYNFFYLRSSIVLTFSIAAYPVWYVLFVFQHADPMDGDIVKRT